MLAAVEIRIEIQTYLPFSAIRELERTALRRKGLEVG